MTSNGTMAFSLPRIHSSKKHRSKVDIEVVAAFDIDKRKVGMEVNEAIFAASNCTARFCQYIPKTGVAVGMGRVLDQCHPK